MKELSIEEKAKRYDNALERAKKLKETCDSNAVVGWMEYIFPELAESEDERIRKELIEFVKSRGGFKQEYISWLEKQGDANKEYWRGYREGKQEILDKYAELEKQGEQKPIDSTFEIKPKFKVGDTIRELETGNLFYVNSIEDFGYTLHYKNCNANGCTMSFKYEDNYELVEQKPAWSEEDEKMLNDIIMCGEHHCYLDAGNIDWLKSIKDRVQPQNSSVTDEELAQAKKEAYNEVLNKIEYDSGEPTFDDGWSAAIWYLKKRNTIPQKQWKPSVFHLECISDAIAIYEERGINAIGLKEILEELKKLRAE